MIRVSNAFSDERLTEQQTISRPSVFSDVMSDADKVKFLYKNVILNPLSTEKVNKIEGPPAAI